MEETALPTLEKGKADPLQTFWAAFTPVAAAAVVVEGPAAHPTSWEEVENPAKKVAMIKLEKAEGASAAEEEAPQVKARTSEERVDKDSP